MNQKFRCHLYFALFAFNIACADENIQNQLSVEPQMIVIEETSNHALSLFEAAKSHQSQKKYLQAILLFKSYIARGGVKDEIWYSKMMIAESYRALKDWDQALHWYLDAYEYDPDRAEPLKNIATHYRLNGENHLAYLFAKQGSHIPIPKDPPQFHTPSVYDYEFDEEISIAGFYTKFKEEGFAAADRLAVKRGVPPHIKEQTYKNIVYYEPYLKDAIFQEIKIDLPLVREGHSEHYLPMNPSIIKTENGYDLICRTVNFTQQGAVIYKTIDPTDETIRTRNFFVSYDQNFNIQSQKEIVENFPRPYWKSHVTGLEDCRLFSFKDGLWFTCTTFGSHPKAIGQTLCKFSKESSEKIIQVEKFIPLEGPDIYRVEKNWQPFIKDGELHVVYLYDPFIIYKIDSETGKYQEVIRHQHSHDFSRFRGSAPPITFDDGYLMVVHEVVFNPHRYYLHRFLYLDKNLKIEKISTPFFFKNQGVEFCGPMTIDHSGKNCLIPVGVEDREAWIAIINLDKIRSLLRPL